IMRRPCADREEKRVTRGATRSEKTKQELDLNNPNQRSLLETQGCESRLTAKDLIARNWTVQNWSFPL
ncbi:hypothetical protein NKJ46_32880, partial [Mesorhizobium sp. M0166]|uniref:hypothetical protein n=1 Tax=Mesorhizobium sp. M0166 TaxID=2956902 RepID=UPI00333D59C2